MPRSPHPVALRAAVVALALLASGAGPIPSGVDPAEFETAARTILCDCGCHPQSVYDCSCGRAEQMREEIAAEIRGGQSGKQVVASYVERFGEQIRIAPTADGFNLVAWLGPGLALLGAAGGLVLVLRRWGRKTHGSAPASEASPAADDPDAERYRQRLRDALEDYDT